MDESRIMEEELIKVESSSEDEDAEDTENEIFGILSAAGVAPREMNNMDVELAEDKLGSEKEKNLSELGIYEDEESMIKRMQTLIADDWVEFDSEPSTGEPSAMKPIMDCKEFSNWSNRKQRNKLSPELSGILGQAQIYWARKKTRSAFNLIRGVVQKQPLAPDGYRMLSTMYEEMNMLEKSFQMRLIAAKLGPTNKYEWVHIAEEFESRGLPRDAISCYTRALTLDPKDHALRMKRAELFEKVGDMRNQMMSLVKLLPVMTDKEEIFNFGSIIVKYYSGEKNFGEASHVARYVLDKCEDNLEALEMYLRVLTTAKEFEQMLTFLEENYGANFDGNEVCITREDIPDIIHLALALFYLSKEMFQQVQEQTELVQDLEKFARDFTDLVDRLSCCGEGWRGRKILTRLVDAGVELETVLPILAELEREAGDDKGYIQRYEQFLALNDSVDAKVRLFDHLLLMGEKKKAMALTAKGETGPALVLRRCGLLIKVKGSNFEVEFTRLLSTMSKEIDCREKEDEFINVYRKVKNYQQYLKEPPMNGWGMDKDELWRQFEELMDIFYGRGDFDLMQQTVFEAFFNSLLVDNFHNRLRHLAIVSAMKNGDHGMASKLVKLIYLRENRKVGNRLANLANVTSRKEDGASLQKALARRFYKKEATHEQMVRFANYSLNAGTYKYALMDFSTLRKQEKSPLTALCMMAAMAQLSCGKFVTNKDTLITHALAFLDEYKRLRGEEVAQEIYYNSGRFMHQFALLPQAMHYYKLALEAPLALDGSEMYDLRKQAAYNLYLIYSRSGEDDLAASIISEYIVI